MTGRRGGRGVWEQACRRPRTPGGVQGRGFTQKLWTGAVPHLPRCVETAVCLGQRSPGHLPARLLFAVSGWWPRDLPGVAPERRPHSHGTRRRLPCRASPAAGSEMFGEAASLLRYRGASRRSFPTNYKGIGVAPRQGPCQGTSLMYLVCSSLSSPKAGHSLAGRLMSGFFPSDRSGLPVAIGLASCPFDECNPPSSKVASSPPTAPHRFAGCGVGASLAASRHRPSR